VNDAQAPQPAAKPYAIDPDIAIAQLVREHPAVVDFLIKEYGFHCVNCIGSHFETLREGAAVHMITGEYFEDLMSDFEKFTAHTKTVELNESTQ
jgi:hybrid cluster-associated redox disulfide protein